VVGIITESDVLAAIVTIAGAGLQGQRICFRIPVERKQEIFFEVVDLCRLHGLDLLTLLSHPIQGESDHLVTIRVEGRKISELMKVFYRRKYRVLLIKE
jgi:hypothetical protein